VFFVKDLDLKRFKAFSPGDLKILGEHNFKNAVMAYTVTKNLKCPEKKIVEVITKFKGNEHRLEFVKKVKGVSFYNDSASTNPQTTIAAVEAFSEPKILIAGGYDKNLSYEPWGKVFPKANIKALILIGNNKQKIKKALINKKITIKTAPSLKEAVQLSKKISVNNDVVILSPGAASFDMFDSYDDRGQKFKNLI
jgi:UDP-N-acetylmuramoylalanine--D-glutamate ligase